MEQRIEKYVGELVERYPKLEACKKEIQETYEILKKAYEKGNKLLVGGNGGSAADAEHIVGELMKGFLKKRRISEEIKERLQEIVPIQAEELSMKLQEALPAISLNAHTALNTAYLNDVDGQLVMAQVLYGYGIQNDVFLGITTSGNSQNVLSAAAVAKAKGLKVIALTGIGGGKINELADVVIAVPEEITFKVQELHIPVYHCICMMLEEYFFGEV